MLWGPVPRSHFFSGDRSPAAQKTANYKLESEVTYKMVISTKNHNLNRKTGFSPGSKKCQFFPINYGLVCSPTSGFCFSENNQLALRKGQCLRDEDCQLLKFYSSIQSIIQSIFGTSYDSQELTSCIAGSCQSQNTFSRIPWKSRERGCSVYRLVQSEMFLCQMRLSKV